jgi:putative hydrolase of the HAD superfamily
VGDRVEAVLWDFGGVLTTSPFEAFNRFEAERGLPRDFIRRVNATNPDANAWALFERAEIDTARFDTLFLEEATALGHAVRGADVLPLLSGDLRPKVVAALEACRARFKVGCITNNVKSGAGAGMSASAEKAAAVAEVMGRFHHVIESSKAGLRKPDPRIYALMCEALDVDPRTCVYLDDLGINLKPARAMGMATIKVETEAQALAELAAATGLSFP